MLFMHYPRCSTSSKAKKWLDDHSIVYEERNLILNNPNAEEIKQWFLKSDYTLKKFFNTSGILYREQGLKDKIVSMTEDEQFSLLATNGMLIKRPLVIGDNFVLVGFKEKEWAEVLLNN